MLPSSVSLGVQEGQPNSQIESATSARIQELRSLVKADLTEYYDTDFNLLRWIQGNSGVKLDEVAVKLRKHLRMRRSYWDLDHMNRVERAHPIHKHWPYGVTGLAGVEESVIVNVEQLGGVDYGGMAETHSMPDILEARAYDLEDMLGKCMEMEAATGRQTSILYVMDMTGLKYDTKLLSLIVGNLRTLTEFMAEHYVELIRSFVLVNVPASIHVIWSLAKSILPERTRQKVQILDSTNWRTEILDYASPHVLPMKWNTTGCNLFKAHIVSPTPFPVENYRKLLHAKTPVGKKLRAPAGKYLLVSNELEKGSLLHWHVVAHADFGMGIFYTERRDEDDTDRMELVVPLISWMPANSYGPAVTGHLEARKAGFYKLWLSNKHAWWSTLNIFVFTEIKKGKFPG